MALTQNVSTHTYIVCILNTDNNVTKKQQQQQQYDHKRAWAQVLLRKT